MSFTFDSNVLIYAYDDGAENKRDRARALLREARNSALILTAQAIGEFLNVVRRKLSHQYPEVRAQAELMSAVFPVVPTQADDIFLAADFAERYKLQLWDSVIWQVAAGAGATIIFSEDMQDGLALDGMMVVNPFNPANDELVRLILADSRTGD